MFRENDFLLNVKKLVHKSIPFLVREEFGVFRCLKCQLWFHRSDLKANHKKFCNQSSDQTAENEGNGIGKRHGKMKQCGACDFRIKSPSKMLLHLRDHG